MSRRTRDSRQSEMWLDCRGLLRMYTSSALGSIRTALDVDGAGRTYLAKLTFGHQTLSAAARDSWASRSRFEASRPRTPGRIRLRGASQPELYRSSMFLGLTGPPRSVASGGTGFSLGAGLFPLQWFPHPALRLAPVQMQLLLPSPMASLRVCGWTRKAPSACLEPAAPGMIARPTSVSRTDRANCLVRMLTLRGRSTNSCSDGAPNARCFQTTARVSAVGYQFVRPV